MSALPRVSIWNRACAPFANGPSTPIREWIYKRVPAKHLTAVNQIDKLVHDWGWWNRAYSRLLIRSRGYRLVSMPKALPSVTTISELTQHANGALFWLEPRQSLHDFRPPRVA